MTDGFDVFVHDVIAAITTWPWSSLNCSPSSVTSTAVAERSASVAPAATAGAGAGSFGAASWPGAPVAGGPGGGEGGGGGAVGRRVGGGERLGDGLVVAVGDLGALVLADELGQRGAEALLRRVQRNAVLRALRAGERRLDRRE